MGVVKKFKLHLCVCPIHVMVHLWRSEDKLLDSVLAFTMWALEMNLGPQAWQ